MAGGDGIPIVDPPLRVGTPSTVHPSPRTPSVQWKPQATLLVLDPLMGGPASSPKRNGTGIFHETSEEVDPKPSLRQTERPGIDDAIRPCVSETFERGDNDIERAAFRELHHERDVLE